MSFIYLLATIFPMWSLPAVYILIELMLSMYRRGKILLPVLLGIVVLINLTFCFFWITNSGWRTFAPGFKTWIDQIS